jgi:hypothetical protein
MLIPLLSSVTVGLVVGLGHYWLHQQPRVSAAELWALAPAPASECWRIIDSAVLLRGDGVICGTAGLGMLRVGDLVCLTRGAVAVVGEVWAVDTLRSDLRIRRLAAAAGGGPGSSVSGGVFELRFYDFSPCLYRAHRLLRRLRNPYRPWQRRRERRAICAAAHLALSFAARSPGRGRSSRDAAAAYSLMLTHSLRRLGLSREQASEAVEDFTSRCRAEAGVLDEIEGKR